MKPVVWLGSTLRDIGGLREALQGRLGYNLYRVQQDRPPVDYRPMPSVGPGVFELRARDEAGIARLMYVAKFRDTVYVLHVFEKKTQKTGTCQGG